MAKIGIFEEAPQKWFRFDADTEVLLQHIDKGRVNTILMQGAEAAKKMKAKAGDMQDIMLGKAAVFGWRNTERHDEPGFLLPDGSPIPFTPENRNRLMTKSKLFSDFVYRVCTDERQFLEQEAPALEPEDLKDLDELLEELEKEEETPGNE